MIAAVVVSTTWLNGTVTTTEFVPNRLAGSWAMETTTLPVTSTVAAVTTSAERVFKCSSVRICSTRPWTS